MPEQTRLAGDNLTESWPDRCRICLLPLPRNADESGICSRRCAGRKVESAHVAENREELKQSILVEISALRKGTSVCPGELSHRVLPGTEQPLSLLRPLIFELAEAGKLRLSQKGTLLPWWKIRGPFRVAGR